MQKKLTVEEAYNLLVYLFGLYKEEAKKGKYILFQEEDATAERIDPASRAEALSAEDGLRRLGGIVYYSLTGIWEGNDTSIKIDGYPRLAAFFWPLLETLISEKETQTIDMIEKRIQGIKTKTDPKEPARTSADEALVRQMVEMFRNKDIYCFKSLVQQAENILYPLEGRDAEEYLDRLEKWIGSRLDFIPASAWGWAYGPEDSLVNMYTKANGIELKGFVDRKEDVKFVENEFTLKGRGLNELKKYLKGKRVVSIISNEKWFLKVIN